MTSSLSRREALAVGAAAAAVGLSSADDARPIRNGRIKQSICSWCFTSAGEKWSLDKLCEIAREMGVTSIELLTPQNFATLKKHGLTCAIASNTMPGSFRTGFNNPKFHDELVERTSRVIDACTEFGCPNVIAFTGYQWKDPLNEKSGAISRDEGADNCVKGLKRLMAHAEKKGVNVCIEHLNTREASHPMKGHPGYQGDDLDYLAKIIRAVGSERMKLLFDVYHVQVMHGDVIRRLEQCKDILGHVHTAGNPGRGELDETQEINYPAVMKKLTALRYGGFVGQEFIPTRDPKAGLTQALKVCDV
jgi:hydroxypyruvate isomerase